MYSLRRTLSVRFSLTMFLALLLIATWAFFGTQRTMRRQLDNGLAAALRLESDMLVSGAPLALHQVSGDVQRFVREVNRFVILRAPDGHILATNLAAAGDFPLDSARLGDALSGRLAWTTGQWKGEWMRSVYGPAPAGRTRGIAVIQVASSMTPLMDDNRRVLFFLFGTVLLGTVATAFGAVWIAGSAVAPVAAIAAEAEAIKPGKTDQRISVHADITELQGLIRVLNSMVERLQHAYEAQRRIIADVGHDLRTPITAARGEIEIALRGERAAEHYRATLASVLEECEHLSALSESLILLARVESGQLVPTPVRIDLAMLAATAVQHTYQRAAGRTLRFERAEEGDAVVLADPRMMGVVLDHLLDNAIRHTPPDTRVTVRVASNADHVTLAVRDDGPGIPADVLPHLFERFYRGDEARTRGGAGLGLTIAQAIVEAHGGTIRAANLQGSGFEILTELPRAPITASDGGGGENPFPHD